MKGGGGKFELVGELKKEQEKQKEKNKKKKNFASAKKWSKTFWGEKIFQRSHLFFVDCGKFHIEKEFIFLLEQKKTRQKT